ncbi:MAG: hypothetical protein WCI72_01270 [archaeon]
MTKQTKNMKNAMRSVALAGLCLLPQASLKAEGLEDVKLTGNVAYFMAGSANSGAQTTYPELNHSLTLPYNTRVSGFFDFYQGDNGYFGKTVVEKGLTDRLNARVNIEHINEPFSRAGFGLSYSLPTPKGTFAKISYLPMYINKEGEKVDNRQVVGFAAGAELPADFSVLAFAEVNVAARKGVQWGYGEVELAKKFGEDKRFSVGLNLQLNNQGAGNPVPEVVPRAVVRVGF